jgi:hypothetical protein
MKHSELVIELICRSFVDSIVYQTMVMKFNINSHKASSSVVAVAVAVSFIVWLVGVESSACISRGEDVPWIYNKLPHSKQPYSSWCCFMLFG